MTESDKEKTKRTINKRFELYCPRCGSSNYYFRSRTGDYQCRKCGEQFLNDSQGELFAVTEEKDAFKDNPITKALKDDYYQDDDNELDVSLE